MAKTMIFSKHRVTAKAYGALVLELAPEFETVTSSTTVADCIREAKEREISWFVFDSISLDTGDVRYISGAQSQGDIKVITIGQAESELEADIIVPLNDDGQGLVNALRELAANQPVVPHQRGRGRPRMTTNGLELSNREYEVAHLISKGFSNEKIAETLSLKEQSVKNLVSTVIRKLHCENRVQVALRLSKLNAANDN